MLLLVVLASARVTSGWGLAGLSVWAASGVGLACADFQGFVGWSTSKPLTGYFKIVYPAQGNYLGSSVEVKVG